MGLADFSRNDGEERPDEPGAAPPLPAGPSSTVGIGSALGIGCLILVVLFVLIALIWRWLGGSW